jgi:hypothetical protein
MNQQLKLVFILDQIENLVALVENNEYESYYISHLLPIFFETKRQLLLTKTQTSTTIKE